MPFFIVQILSNLLIYTGIAIYPNPSSLLFFNSLAIFWLIFLNNIKMCSLSANLGDTRTIVTHPASTTHGRLSEEDRLEVGITAGLVRVSVGLENVNDIINDLKQALEDA